MSRLANKKAVITGGTTGIGFATAQRFLEEGAQVIITGNNEERLQKAKEQLGGGVTTVKSNAADLSDIKKLAQKVKDEFGTIDALFVNAGIAPMAPLAEADEAHFDLVNNVNYKGLYFTVQALVPLMNKPGSIILNTSVVDQKGFAGMTVYSATKAAVRSLARTFAAELVGDGIRVNCVAPGPIETPIFGKMGIPEDQKDEMAKQMAQMVPMKRFGQPDEVAGAVVFFASDESSFITGQDLAIDGGMAAL
ncbi:SDR family oxidoreductase [bacterium]|nr:SDR family oxidoreductase [bacterium]